MGLNIAVIFGGKSVEHEISVISAHQCMKAINKEKYNIIPIYISKQGGWYTGSLLSDLDNFQDLEVLLAKSQKIIINQNSGSGNFYLEPQGILTKRKPVNIDLIFPVMHGSYGEDGSLQGLLAMMDIPYVGCDVLAAAITMDKITSKLMLQSLGIKVLDYFWFYSEAWVNSREQVLLKLKAKFNYPLVVKPNNLGSSIGVNVVNSDLELEDAVDLVVRLSSRVLIEPQLVTMREINCALLGDHESIELSECEEPIRSEQILSYQDKYAGGKNGKLGKGATGVITEGMSGAKRQIPAMIPAEVKNKIQAIAKEAFLGLNCQGVVRIDFLWDQKSGEIYLCELNSIPGSLAFYLWEPLGKSFTEIVERLIELALKRQREINNLVLSYSNNILQRWHG